VTCDVLTVFTQNRGECSRLIRERPFEGRVEILAKSWTGSQQEINKSKGMWQEGTRIDTQEKLLPHSGSGSGLECRALWSELGELNAGSAGPQESLKRGSGVLVSEKRNEGEGSTRHSIAGE